MRTVAFQTRVPTVQGWCFGKGKMALRLSLIATAGLVSSTSVLAQNADYPRNLGSEAEATQLGEIVVTAQRREQRLQDVPVAITAVSGQMLTANRVVSTRDLDSLVPNLTTRSAVGGTGSPTYTIRGEFANAAALGADRGIALYVDDVYIAATNGSLFELPDLERIEVLRGPQGTLFGRNSTAGAISFHTAEPAHAFGVRQLLTVGNYDQFRSSTRINTGNLGPFSAALTYTHSERRGDIRNLRGGTVWDFSPNFGGRQVNLRSAEWLGSNNTDAIAATLKFEPSDALKFVYRFDNTDTRFSSDGVGLVFAGGLVRSLLATQDPGTVSPISKLRPDAVNNGNTVPSHSRGFGHNLQLSVSISPEITVKNILAYRMASFESPWVDILGSGYLINTGAAAFTSVLGASLATSTVGQPVILQALNSTGVDRQWSYELQGNYRSTSVTMTLGALLFRNKQSRSPLGDDVGLGRARAGVSRVYPDFRVPFAGQPAGTMGRESSIIAKSYAIYGQAEVHLTRTLDFVAGARYTWDRKKGVDRTLFSGANSVEIPLAYSGERMTYNIGVNYSPSRGQLLYAKYSTGYISGGTISGIEFGPQTAKSVEIGAKVEWFDRILRTNLAMFRVDYGNIQFTSLGSNITPPRPDLAVVVVTAGSGRANGFELEAELAPAHGLLFTGSVGYTDFKFTTLEPVVTVGTAEYYPSMRPKWTLNVSGQYKFQLGVGNISATMRADANYRSALYLTPAIPASLSASDRDAFRSAMFVRGYWIANARLALEGFKVGVTDVGVALWGRNIFDNRSQTWILSTGSAAGSQYERARTFGIDLTAEF